MDVLAKDYQAVLLICSPIFHMHDSLHTSIALGTLFKIRIE